MFVLVMLGSRQAAVSLGVGGLVAAAVGLEVGGRWRVFVSHTSELRKHPAARSYVAEVERAISAVGHVVVDMADFPSVDGPPAEVCEQRVLSCDVYVGVLGMRYGSPVRDRPEVSYTEWEFDTATRAGLVRLVFVMDTEVEHPGVPVSALTDHEFGARQDAFRRRIDDAGVTAQRFTGPSHLGQLVERSLRELPDRAGGPASRPDAVVDNLPLGSVVFEGRDLAVLADVLHGGSDGAFVGQAAVHGLGGIGKTELAVRYARAFRERYGLVWWITADTAENVQLGLAGLASRLHPAATLADAQAWALTWLQNHAGWLLVLDNVEDVADIEPLLGQVAGRGRIVVTTRRDLGAARWARFGLTPVRLEVLDRAASVRLLCRLTGSGETAAADRLAAVLGDLPLALEQAAAYVSQHEGLGFDGYLRLLTDRFGLVAADPGEGGSAQRAVSAIWQASLEAVAARSVLAVLVLDLLAWLGPDALPEDVLGPLVEDPVESGDALAVLASFSLVTRSRGEVSVHRLVQEVVRRRQLPAEEPISLIEAAVKLLLVAIPEDPATNVAGWPRWNQLLPHIDALTEHAGLAHTDTNLMFINDRAATYRHSQGQLPAAISLFEQVLTDRRRVLGDDDPDTLNSRHNLAYAYQAAGRAAEAITLYEPLLTDRRRVLGDDHRDTLTSRNNLAVAYHAAGRAAEAIALHVQVISDYRRVLGDDDAGTINSRDNLAVAYHAAGRAAEAIGLHQQVITDFRRVLGDDHPDTLTSRHNLAVAYHAAGKVAEAITLYEQVLTDQRRVLGGDHPHTLASRHNLAYAYQAAGRAAEAITLYEQVLTDRRRVLGNDHPDTRETESRLQRVFNN